MLRRHNQRVFRTGAGPHLGENRIRPNTCYRRVKAGSEGS